MQQDDIIVFLGPTLPEQEARAVLDADYRAPARRGDIYAAVRSEPSAIVLIDGLFESEPSVQHQEILWALAQNVTVWGAASMGALRAAELAACGMRGHGVIFQDYLSGRTVRDDAVALVHGPAELGYPLLSLALVDIVATLWNARAQGLLSPEEHLLLREVAGTIFYKNLRLETLIEQAGQMGLASGRVASLARVLPQAFVSQKRLDALGVLHALASASAQSTMVELAVEQPMGGLAARPSAPPQRGSGWGSEFAFEWTFAWERLRVDVLSAEVARVTEPGTDPTAREALIEDAALGMLLAEQEAHRRGLRGGEERFADAARNLRLRLGLTTSERVVAWMEEHRLCHADYVDLVKHQAMRDGLFQHVDGRTAALQIARATALAPRGR